MCPPSNAFLAKERLWRMEPVLADGALPALAALEHATAADKPIGLVLSDVLMPDIDGFDLAERIRQRSAYARLPILMLSSAPVGRQEERMATLGISK